MGILRGQPKLQDPSCKTQMGKHRKQIGGENHVRSCPPVVSNLFGRHSYFCSDVLLVYVRFSWFQWVPGIGKRKASSQEVAQHKSAMVSWWDARPTNGRMLSNLILLSSYIRGWDWCPDSWGFVLNITFKYLLEIICPMVGSCLIGTFTNPVYTKLSLVFMVFKISRAKPLLLANGGIQISSSAKPCLSGFQVRFQSKLIVFLFEPRRSDDIPFIHLFLFRAPYSQYACVWN